AWSGSPAPQAKVAVRPGGPGVVGRLTQDRRDGAGRQFSPMLPDDERGAPSDVRRCRAGPADEVVRPAHVGAEILVEQLARDRAGAEVQPEIAGRSVVRLADQPARSAEGGPRPAVVG